jgi:uncharacterized protein involved in outer membrane biogenesis
VQRLLWTVTALAALLLAAIIVLPRLIDWNAYRDEIAAAAARVTGRPVTIAGDVRLLLLPTPTLSAASVRIGNPPGFSEQPFAEIKSLDARFAFLPLLLGRVEVESVALIEPVLSLRERPDGSANWRMAAELEGVSFERLIVVDGTIAWSGSHPDRIARINAELIDQPPDGATGGGWRIAGDAEFHALVWQGSASMGAPGSLSRSASASLALRGGAASLRVNGTLTGEDWQHTAFAGRLTGEAARPAVLLRLVGLATPEPLTSRGTIEARVTADARSVALEDLAIAVGELRLAGRAALGFDPALTYDAKLAANRIDLARWLVAAPPGPERIVTPITALTQGGILDGTLSLGIDAIFWGDGLIRDAKLETRAEGGILAIRQASAQLPGGSDLSLFGQLDSAGRFAGRMEAGSDNLRALLAWLAIDIGAVPADRLRRAAATAALEASNARIDVSALDLSFDSSKLTGEIGVSLGERLGVTADLTLDQANLDAYLPGSLPGFAGAWRDTTDLALRLHADQVSWRSLPIGDAALAITLHRGNFDTAANIADFAGGRLQLGASWARGTADGQADAILRFAIPEAGRLAPLIAADATLPMLGAADIKLDLHGPAAHPQVKLTASLAGATLDAEGTAGFDGSPAAIAIGFDHPSALALLQRFLPAYLPSGDAAGPLALAGHLTWQAGIATLEDITARVGPTNLVGTLSFDAAAVRPRLVASLAASALDLGLLPGGAALGWGMGGDRWFDALDMDFGLRAGAVDAGALSFDDVAATGSLRQHMLTVPSLSASWLGGALTGSAKAELGASPSLGLDVALQQGEIGQAAALLVGDPDATGRFDLTASLAAGGGDVASLAGSLAGAGTLRAGAGAIGGFDLPHTASLLLQPATIGTLLPKVTALLSTGSTRFESVEGEISFAGGGVRALIGRVMLAPPAPSLAVSADLAHDRIELAPVDAKEGWRLLVSGALGAQSAAAGSPAATKIYDVLPIAAP